MLGPPLFEDPSDQPVERLKRDKVPFRVQERAAEISQELPGLWA
jgi:hypothetical protein